MSFYHISTSLNRQKPRINIRENRKHVARLAKCKNRAISHCSKSSLVRPVYMDDDSIAGYITIPLSEWASTLIL